MRKINHPFSFVSLRKIVKALSALWRAIDQYSLDESELNAPVRYSVADQITNELERNARVRHRKNQPN